VIIGGSWGGASNSSSPYRGFKLLIFSTHSLSISQRMQKIKLAKQSQRSFTILSRRNENMRKLRAVNSDHVKRGFHVSVLTTHEPGGGGGTPYNSLHGEAPPERGTFFRLQVYKTVGISQAEVNKW